MSSIVTSEEKQILDNMFNGDKNRDASSTIRGFLFQDLVAIESLLDDSVENVCLEYLEDVDVCYKDGTFNIIQVKYYPHTYPKIEEIMTDLYYQYLRMFLLKSKLTIKPLLVIHRPQTVNILDLEGMKLAVNPGATEQPKVFPDFEYFNKNIHPLKKAQQKEALFSRYAYESSIKDFLGQFEIVYKNNMECFLDELEEKLEQTFSGIGFYGDIKDKKKVLIGLAISYVQRRYKVENPNFDILRINRQEFYEEIKECIRGCDDENIVAYLKSIALQVINEIVDYNDMSEHLIQIVNGIYLNTLDWLSDIGGNVKGQFQLVNTLSDNDVKAMKRFSELDVMNRLMKISECQRGIKHFLKYLWKIILDICLDKADFDIYTDANMMKPQTYVVSNETNYICIKFPKDCVDTSVIVWANSESPKRSRRILCDRMLEIKPEKWFMKGNESGKYDYSYSTANIRQGNSVIDGDDDSFVIECMKCIKVDVDEWSINDNCEDCIFSQTCYERKE